MIQQITFGVFVISYAMAIVGCCSFLLGAVVCVLIMHVMPARRQKRSGSTALAIKVDFEKEEPELVPIPVESSQTSRADPLVDSLLSSPPFDKAGLFVKNAEHELRLAQNLRQDSLNRTVRSSQEFQRNAFMAAEIGNIDTRGVDETDALRRYREISNYALEHALAFREDDERFSVHCQQLEDEVVALTHELQDLAAELRLKAQAKPDSLDDDCGIVAYFESLSRSLSERATKLKIEAKILVAYVDTITGMLFEARSLGEFVLSSQHSLGEQ